MFQILELKFWWASGLLGQMGIPVAKSACPSALVTIDPPRQDMGYFDCEYKALWVFYVSHYISACIISLCNHVTLYGLASPRLLHSLIDHIKTSHSFKHGYSNGRWVVLYALVSPQWSHAWFRGRVRTILLPAAKLYPCVNKLGGSM